MLFTSTEGKLKFCRDKDPSNMSSFEKPAPMVDVDKTHVSVFTYVSDSTEVIRITDLSPGLEHYLSPPPLPPLPHLPPHPFWTSDSRGATIHPKFWTRVTETMDE